MKSEFYFPLNLPEFPSNNMKPWYTKNEISEGRRAAIKILSKLGKSGITCHVRVPKNIDLSVLFPNIDSANKWRLTSASLVDKEVDICLNLPGIIQLELYAHRTRISRLRQCGLFAMHEHHIELKDLEVFLVKIIHFSEKRKPLKIEFDNLETLPKNLQYMSDDSSSECY